MRTLRVSTMPEPRNYAQETPTCTNCTVIQPPKGGRLLETKLWAMYH